MVNPVYNDWQDTKEYIHQQVHTAPVGPFDEAMSEMIGERRSRPNQLRRRMRRRRLFGSE